MFKTKHSSLNFWQKTTRFLEPCIKFPGVTIGRILMTGNTTCFTLYLAYLLKEVVSAIEA